MNTTNKSDAKVDAAAAEYKPTRKRGRPENSQTADRPVVELTPTPCPHCQAIAKPISLHRKRRIEGAGRLPDGRRYGAVELRNANCGSCGRPILLRTHEFVT